MIDTKIVRQPNPADDEPGLVVLFFDGRPFLTVEIQEAVMPHPDVRHIHALSTVTALRPSRSIEQTIDGVRLPEVGVAFTSKGVSGNALAEGRWEDD